MRRKWISLKIPAAGGCMRSWLAVLWVMLLAVGPSVAETAGELAAQGPGDDQHHRIVGGRRRRNAGEDQESQHQRRHEPRNHGRYSFQRRCGGLAGRLPGTAANRRRVIRRRQ